MTQARTEESVIKIISDYLGIKELTPETTFAELAMDELDVIELSFEIENQFQFEIDTDVSEKWISIKDVIVYLKNNNLII